jgi:thioredoxin-like negative regulator of GroEL
MKTWTLDSFLEFIHQQEFVITFFEGKNCRVCHALFPKLETLAQNEFSEIPLIVVNTDENPDIAGQNIVFTLPLIIIFKQGREVVRISGKQPMFQITEELRRTLQVNDGEHPFSAFLVD